MRFTRIHASFSTEYCLLPVPRWLETHYFLSLGEAEFDDRWADYNPSLDSLIGDKYAYPPF